MSCGVFVAVNLRCVLQGQPCPVVVEPMRERQKLLRSLLQTILPDLFAGSEAVVEADSMSMSSLARINPSQVPKPQPVSSDSNVNTHPLPYPPKQLVTCLSRLEVAPDGGPIVHGDLEGVVEDLAVTQITQSITAAESRVQASLTAERDARKSVV